MRCRMMCYMNKTENVTITARMEATISVSWTCSFCALNKVVIFFISKVLKGLRFCSKVFYERFLAQGIGGFSYLQYVEVPLMKVTIRPAWLSPPYTYHCSKKFFGETRKKPLKSGLLISLEQLVRVVIPDWICWFFCQVLDYPFGFSIGTGLWIAFELRTLESL